MNLKMLTVGIVDDEELIRRHIKNSIDWEKLQMSVRWEAEDGKKAQSKIEQLSADIIIIDINIPYIDGLELSEWISLYYPLIKIIILTGYREFEYARRAISSQVADYILKPIDKAEFEQSLAKVRLQIEQEKKQAAYLSNLEDRIHKSETSEIKTALHKILTREITDKNGLREVAGLTDLLDVEKPLCLLVFSIISDKSLIALRRDQDLILSAFSHHLEVEFISAVMENSVVLISPLCDERTIKELSNNIENEVGIQTVIGVASIEQMTEDIVNEIYENYNEAKTALEESFFYPDKKLFTLPVPKRRDVTLIPDKHELLIAFRTEDLIKIKVIIDIDPERLETERISRESILLMALEFISVIKQFLQELNLSLEILPIEGIQSYQQMIRRFSTFGKLKAWLHHVINSVFEHVKREELFTISRSVIQTKQYIENQFHNPRLMLRQIAEEININPSYLSKIFKRQTGLSVLEYIRDCRLKEAKIKIDEDPTLHISELSQIVGYEDPLYFSKVFKRKFGISPKQYRKKVKL